MLKLLELECMLKGLLGLLTLPYCTAYVFNKEKNHDFPFLVCLQISQARKCLDISKYSNLQTKFLSTILLKDTFFYYLCSY